MTPLLEARGLHVRRARVLVLKNISLSLSPGEVWGLLGPNGAGKSSLLDSFVGSLLAESGSIRLAGRELAHCSTLERARSLALVGRERTQDLALSVRALVELGRFPHRTRWGLSPEDKLAVERALEQTGCIELAPRPLYELSDGERQRAQWARALAQAPSVLLLDEATAHLDLAQRERSLLRTREFAAQGSAVLAVLHDIDLAVRHCTHVAVLQAGELVAAGAPCSVLTASRLRQVFQVEAHIEQHERGASLRVHGVCP